jgi:K+ potassium transporter
VPTGFDRGRALVVTGLFGAALIYGEGIITPAISVLNALESALDKVVCPGQISGQCTSITPQPTGFFPRSRPKSFN